MKNYLIIALIFFQGIQLFASLKSSLVLDPKERQKTLMKGNSIENASHLQLMGIPSPFFNQNTGITPTSVDVKGMPQTPEEILGLIAANLRPTGFLRKGKVQTLFLANGSLKVGESFTASVAGKSYTVRLSNLTDRTFTLELDHTHFESLIEPISSQALRFDP